MTPSPNLELSVQRAYAHVFVYGTLRRGDSNDITRLRPAPQFRAYASVMGSLFHLGAYPGLRLEGATVVKGEVYAITPALEAKLDVIEEIVPGPYSEYSKQTVLVPVDGESLPCLVYVIHADRVKGRALIESGDWLAR